MKRMKISRFCVLLFIMIFAAASVCSCGKSTKVENDTTVDRAESDKSGDTSKTPSNDTTEDSDGNGTDSSTKNDQSSDSSQGGTEVTGENTSDTQADPEKDVHEGAGEGLSENDTSSGNETLGASDSDDDDDDSDDGEDDDEDETGFVYDDDDEYDDFEDDDDDIDEEMSPNDVLRESAWEDSYLIWLPIFEDGYFEKVTVDNTYDYMVFSSVDYEAAVSYKNALEAAGFTMDADEEHGENYLKYSAYNENDWFADIEFDAGKFVIGSGYIEREQDESAAIREVFANAGLPFPEFGELSSGFAGGESGETYIVLTDVSEKAVQGYIADAADAGFNIDVDTDEEDGIIWYWAESGNGYMCDIQYFDGTVRISCGQ